MRRRLLIALMAMVCLVNSAISYASSSENCSEEIVSTLEKMYVDIDQVECSDNKIYVTVDDFVILTPALYCDDKGYYIFLAAKSGNCAWCKQLSPEGDSFLIPNPKGR
jgi:hypothetical protein